MYRFCKNIMTNYKGIYLSFSVIFITAICTVADDGFIKKTLRSVFRITGYEIVRIKDFNDDELYHKQYSEESIKKRRFYNISAGGHFDFGCGIHHPLWTNIDIDIPWKDGINYNPERDIAHDLLSLKPLPVKTEIAEVVYSRVAIEHITDEAALVMFREVHRILKKGGFFRIVAPNIDLDYRAFINRDTSYFYWGNRFSIERVFQEHFANGVAIQGSDSVFKRLSDEQFRQLFQEMKFEDALNFCTSRCPVSTKPEHRGNHINWWNPSKLERMLRVAGFNTIYLSAAEQSACPILRNEHYFDNVFQKCMMYMETVKD